MNKKEKKQFFLSNLEDSKNLNTLDRIAANGTSSAYKRALRVSDEIIYAREGQIIREVKGKKTQVIENISPRKATKGEVYIIERNNINV